MPHDKSTFAGDKFAPGDVVSVDHPKYGTINWTIRKRGPKNTVLDPVTPDGSPGRALQVPHYMLKAPIDTNLAGGAGDIVVVPVPVVTFFNPGEIVRVSSGKFAGVYVVINDPGRDNVSIAKLGGDGGRYVRMARRALTKVDPADVLA